MSFYFAYKPYVPVAQRREQAAAKLKKLQKGGNPVSPVVLEGRTIATSFWGKSWCENLERYSDYASRLPRGRSYVRNGSVLDLQIAEGEITAKVSGSELYTISITIAPVTAERWTSLAKDCAGTIDSVVELLQGRIDKGVMDRVCRQGDGLFPSPKEIRLSCSCPDWADMCKHVAAALYGVGARLDRQPELLFALRGVDAQDMIAKAGAHLATPVPGAESDKVLADDDMAALFDLDMAEEAIPAAGGAALPKRKQSERSTKRMVAKAVASKRNNAAAGSAAITGKVRPGHGKPSTGSGADRGHADANANASATSLKRPRGRQESLSESLKSSTTKGRKGTKGMKGTKGKAKSLARGATTKAQARLDVLIAEAIVDAYGEAEQAVGFHAMICDQLALPFKTKILGHEADVIAIEMEDDDRLVAVCKAGRRRQRVSLADLALPSKRPAGAEWIAAYQRWCGNTGLR